MAGMPSPKPRRRWYQFGLSTLLIGLTLFSLPLGYVAWEREQCRRGETAREMIYRHEGSGVMFSGREFDDLLDQIGGSSNHRPEWLKAILGNDQFRRKDSARLSGDSFSAAELRQLEALPN
jgi:hypothetical protein